MRTRYFMLFAFIILYYSIIQAQDGINPELSVIGDLKSSIHNNELESSKNKLKLHTPEAEIHVDGNLHHNTKAHVVFGWHDNHSAELEEIYATIQSNNRLGFKIGKFLLDFDNLNILHSHQYSFILRPLAYQTFFGDDGLRDMAVEIQYSFHEGENKNFLFGLLQGDFMKHAAHEEGEHDEEPAPHLGFYGRAKTELATSKFSKIKIGVSLLNGVHEIFEDSLFERVYRSWILNGDIKYSYLPSHSTSLDFLSQIIFKWSENELDDSYLGSYGYFCMFDYHFAYKYNIGALFEYLKLNEIHNDEFFATAELVASSTKQFALFTGYQFDNGTKSRLLLGHTKEKNQNGYWEAILQLVIEIGPHSGHNH